MTPDPTPADLHAMDILIESAASEAARHAPEPSYPDSHWDIDAIGCQLAAVTMDRDTWRLAAGRWCHACRWWPWVCAGLVFGWALSLWMVMHG